MYSFLLNELVFHYQHGEGKIIEICNDEAVIVFATGRKTVNLPRVLKSGVLQLKNPSIDKNRRIELIKNEKKEIKLFDQDKLDKIVKTYQQDFENKKNLFFVVKNSLPIIWFGNIEKYFSSKKKIVSIGLNPSDKEFVVKRFKAANDLKKQLNEYFEFNPYRTWFQWFENVLNPLNASYGGKMSNRQYDNIAIHIDVYSAIATNPTFGKLTFSQKELLRNTLFRELFNFLNPDIILFSANVDVRREYFSRFRLVKDIPYQGKHNMLTIYKNDKKLLISGRNMRGIPFGGMKKEFIQQALIDLKV